MSFENRRWVIITLADYTLEELEDLVLNAIQTSTATLRKSIDKTKTILKWTGSTPECFSGMTQYSHSEILAILATNEWSEDIG